MKFDTKIWAAFCGTGKTYICKNTNIKAVDVEYWKYKEKRFLNRYLSVDDINKEYIDDIKKYMGTVDYIFIATDPEGLRILNSEGFNITIVYPKNELRSEYLDRYIERDSSEDFIGLLMKNWNTWIDELKEQKYCEHIILKEGEYLQDLIK